MLGTAANSSIAVPKNASTFGGAHSTRNSAIASPIGIAISMAIRVETPVPKMLLRAPYSCVIGFHAVDVRKPRPNFFRARCELNTITHTSPAINTGIAAAQTAVIHLKTLSPATGLIILPGEFSSRTSQTAGTLPDHFDVNAKPVSCWI